MDWTDDDYLLFRLTVDGAKDTLGMLENPGTLSVVQWASSQDPLAQALRIWRVHLGARYELGAKVGAYTRMQQRHYEIVKGEL